MTNLIDQSSIRISIHALREEGDCKSSEASSSLSIFLSTPSARRATPANMTLIRANMISIHALREEGDLILISETCGTSYFYPRPPRGGRRFPVGLMDEIAQFLSTPSARRATTRCRSGHTPKSDFYPRPPRGGRREVLVENYSLRYISIHALREEGDRGMRRGLPDLRNFYPRPPRGGRLVGVALDLDLR